MGLQTLDRAVAALRALGASGPAGLRLVDLQQSLRLTKPTAHRLLAALAELGLVTVDADSRRYRLGPELAILGRSASAGSHDLGRLLAHSAALLAEETGDTVFASARSGVDTVCIDRQTGAYPVKALTVEVGTRRPLGVGGGGLAILAALDPDEADSLIDAVAPRLAAHGRASAAQVRSAVVQARRTGYAVSNGFVSDNVRSVGVAIRDASGQPVAGLGVAAISMRIPDARVRALAKLLLRERSRIEARLNTARAGPGRGSGSGSDARGG